MYHEQVPLLIGCFVVPSAYPCYHRPTQTQGLLLQVRVAWVKNDHGRDNGVISRHKAEENRIIDACGAGSGQPSYMIHL